LRADSPFDALANFTPVVAIAGSFIGVAACFGARSLIRSPPTVRSAIALWALLTLSALPPLTVSVTSALTTGSAITFFWIVSVVPQFPNETSEFVETLPQLLAHGGYFFFIQLAVAILIEGPQNALACHRTTWRIRVVALAPFLCKCQCRQCQHAGSHQRDHRLQMTHEIDLA
jgi:hypothetical protein